MPPRRGFPPRLATALAVVFLGVGLYYPTSYQKRILIDLVGAAGALLLLTLVALLARRRGALGGVSLVASVSSIVVLLAATLFSPFTEITYGAAMPYLLLALLLTVRLDDIPLTGLGDGLFTAVSVVNLAAGVLVVLRTPVALEFLIAHYSTAYPELVPYMLNEAKPVLTFGSHSIAGFFFYLFSHLNFQAYRSGRGRRHLAIALFYIGLLLCLTSFTAYVAAAVASLQLILHFQLHRSMLTAITASLILLAVGTMLAVQADWIAPLAVSLEEVMKSDNNGFVGRYSSSGALAANLNFIAENPFSPIGMGFSNRLFYGDSGPIEHMTRGSFPLVLAIYGGFYLFLRRNLRSSKEAHFLFLAYLAFEIGYSNLNYMRTLFFLPFVVIYLNGVGRDAIAGRPHA